MHYGRMNLPDTVEIIFVDDDRTDRLEIGPVHSSIEGNAIRIHLDIVAFLADSRTLEAERLGDEVDVVIKITVSDRGIRDKRDDVARRHPVHRHCPG